MWHDPRDIDLFAFISTERKDISEERESFELDTETVHYDIEAISPRGFRDRLQFLRGKIPPILRVRRTWDGVPEIDESPDEAVMRYRRQWILSDHGDGTVALQPTPHEQMEAATKLLQENHPYSQWVADGIKRLPKQQTITIRLPRDVRLTQAKQIELERFIRDIVLGRFAPQKTKKSTPAGA